MFRNDSSHVGGPVERLEVYAQMKGEGADGHQA
jgi:hypothetical protein